MSIETDESLYRKCPSCGAAVYSPFINRVEKCAHCNQSWVVEKDGLRVATKDEIASRQSSAPRRGSSAPRSTGTGCYIATAVYGSYDCPQVWTLRRYRDYTLAASWHGRLFINAYYAISPMLVRWFGNTKWFVSLWKPQLDRIVKRLNRKGIMNSPYSDRQW